MDKHIKVVVRVRPSSFREIEQNQRRLVRILDTNTIIFDPDEDVDDFYFHGSKQNFRDLNKRANKNLSMEYDEVFDDKCSNSDVFNSCMKPLVTTVMNGYNCSVFVYGATGAGKTHTMLGNENCSGIIVLTISEIYKQMQELDEKFKFEVGISYLEVYNEQVMNLLTKTGPLKLREDSNGVVVRGLNLIKIDSADELYNLLIKGNKNRTQHPTDANAESSRSHAIFQVHIRMTNKITSEKRTIKLSMIDLAGSERAASTKGMGLRFKEGASINKSLLALGNCINNLADGLKHIPFRDSNLTRILKDSLGGNCQTLMIANISPSSLSYEDTYNTLKYALRARSIRTKLSATVATSNMPKEFYIKKINSQQNELQKLQATIKQLEEKLNSTNSFKLPNKCDKQTTAAVISLDSPEILVYFNKIDSIYASLHSSQQNCLTLLSKIKVLKFQTNLKREIEICSKIFQIDSMSLDANLDKLQASISKYDKDINYNENEMLKWQNRFNIEAKNLKEIRKQISNHPQSKVIQLYLKTKIGELELAKAVLKENHIRKIIGIHQSEADINLKALRESYEIIQENYLLLRAKGGIDLRLKEKMDGLLRLVHRQRSVKFVDAEAVKNLEESDLESLDLNIDQNDVGFVLNKTMIIDEVLPSTSNIKFGLKRENCGFKEIDFIPPNPKQHKVNLFKTKFDSKTEENLVSNKVLTVKTNNVNNRNGSTPNLKSNYKKQNLLTDAHKILTDKKINIIKSRTLKTAKRLVNGRRTSLIGTENKRFVSSSSQPSPRSVKRRVLISKIK